MIFKGLINGGSGTLTPCVCKNVLHPAKHAKNSWLALHLCTDSGRHGWHNLLFIIIILLLVAVFSSALVCDSIATCESSMDHLLSDWQRHTPHYYAYYTQIEPVWWITTWIMMDCKAGHYIKTQKQSAISKTHWHTVVGDCIVRSCFWIHLP